VTENQVRDLLDMYLELGPHVWGACERKIAMTVAAAFVVAVGFAVLAFMTNRNLKQLEADGEQPLLDDQENVVRFFICACIVASFVAGMLGIYWAGTFDYQVLCALSKLGGA